MNAIVNQIIRIQQAKDDMRTALAEHGLIVPAVSKLEDFSEYVDAIFVETPIHKSFIDIVSRSSYTVDIIPDPPPTNKSIRSYAFYGCTNLALTSLPSGITSIGSYAFRSCIELALTSLPSGITSIGSQAFYYCTKLALTSLPSGISSIGASAFYYCTKLALTSLPSGITSIGDSAFYICPNLALTSLPPDIKSIGNYAFRGCTSLQSITFEGTPSGTISSTSFTGCTNLTTINVPWASGVKAGAPWGATNATINYNYTG